MKKNLISLAAITLCFSLLACGGGKETPASIAAKWCELNGKVHKATSDAEKAKAKDAIDAFEKTMDAKYEKDEAFMKQVKAEVEKCEDASEGR